MSGLLSDKKNFLYCNVSLSWNINFFKYRQQGVSLTTTNVRRDSYELDAIYVKNKKVSSL